MCDKKFSTVMSSLFTVLSLSGFAVRQFLGEAYLSGEQTTTLQMTLAYREEVMN